jgi:TRAP-type C4-dicarboxylate transport system permease small subunit
MTTPLPDVASAERPGTPPGRSAFPLLVLDRFEEVVGGTAFVGMTAMVFVNVVCRYVLNSPIPGSDELATLAFTWAVFLGASLCIRRQLHLGIEFVTRRFSPRLQALLGLTVSLIIAAFAVMLLVYGGKIMRTGHLKLTPVFQWPYTWVYLAIPVGAALMLLRLMPIARAQVKRLRGDAGAKRSPGGGSSL